MASRTIHIHQLGKFIRLLSICLFAIALLAGINLHQANAREDVASPDTPTEFCDGVTEIPVSECQALEALYYSTGGDGWTNKTNWLVTNTPSNWVGVYVTSGHVTSIELDNNNLNGSIPPELGNLIELRYLFLGYSGLTGSIPPELGSLTALQELYLIATGLTGSIPPELGNLTALQILFLSQNQLTGSIPPELGNLSSLDQLYLNRNQLTGSIPPELGNLSSLDELYLNRNRLSGSIPPELGNLTTLNRLYLDNNHLTGQIPTSIANLTGLSVWLLKVDYNALYTSDTSVETFMNGFNPGWANTQTVAPHIIEVNPISTTAVELAWIPITYTAGGGYYEVTYATNEAGPYSIAGNTVDKTIGGMTVSGLTPGQDYYFRVRTLTATDWLGPTELWSDYSPILSLSMPLAQAEITPENGGELSFHPADDGTITIQAPGGAVDETIILQVTRNPAVVAPPGSALVGVSFNITAIKDGEPVDGYVFQAPVTIRVDYTDEQVAGLDEDSLRLYFWDEATEDWLDSAQTCDPLSTYTRNPGENWFSVSICHLTQFAVFGEIQAEGFSIFLPTLGK